MTSTVSPVGSDPSGHDPVSDTESDPSTVRKGRLRRIAEEEYILVVLLAGFGLIFLLIFPPALVVNDSWLNLVAGREVVENGLPSRDELTVYGLGATWTDQQWLAQVFMYGVYSLGGFALLSIATCVSVVGAFSIAAAAARSLGAGARAFWVMFLPVLVAAPWAWSIRAQMLALPLYTGPALAPRDAGTPADAASVARLPAPRRLGEPARQRRARRAPGDAPRRATSSSGAVAAPGREASRSSCSRPLAVLATPYGPAATVRYYHLLLVDPPFAGRVTEWRVGELRPRTRCSSTCSRRSRSCSSGSGGAG